MQMKSKWGLAVRQRVRARTPSRQPSATRLRPTPKRLPDDDDVQPNQPFGEGYVQTLENKVRTVSKENEGLVEELKRLRAEREMSE